MTSYLSAQPYTWEIIVAADGNDGTRQRVAERGKTDPRISVLGSEKRSGKGKGVRLGVQRATGQIIGFLDADYKTPIDEIAKLLPALHNEGYDIAIGSRAVAGAKIERYQPLYRRLGSKAFRWIMHAIIGLRDISDTQCGFKFFKAAAAREIFNRQKIDGYMFDVEILRLAKLLGYRIRQIGIDWRDDADSRYNPVTGTIKNARELLKIRWITRKL